MARGFVVGYCLSLKFGSRPEAAVGDTHYEWLD
jgi:hypothetical protein